MECCSGTKEEFDPARLQSRIAPGNGPTLGMALDMDPNIESHLRQLYHTIPRHFCGSRCYESHNFRCKSLGYCISLSSSMDGVDLLEGTYLDRLKIRRYPVRRTKVSQSPWVWGPGGLRLLFKERYITLSGFPRLNQCTEA